MPAAAPARSSHQRDWRSSVGPPRIRCHTRDIGPVPAPGTIPPNCSRVSETIDTSRRNGRATAHSTTVTTPVTSRASHRSMPEPGRNSETTSSACRPASAPTTSVFTIAAPATRSSAGRMSGFSTATTATAGAVITSSRSMSIATSTSTLDRSWNSAMHMASTSASTPAPTRLPDLPWKYG